MKEIFRQKTQAWTLKSMMVLLTAATGATNQGCGDGASVRASLMQLGMKSAKATAVTIQR